MCRRHYRRLIKWSVYANWHVDGFCILPHTSLKHSALHLHVVSGWCSAEATLRPTLRGPDNLLVSFLRLGAPIFCRPKPLTTDLLNLSLSTSVVPIQWKLVWIRPVPKVSAPTQHPDYRPISNSSFARMHARGISSPAVYLPRHSQISSHIWPTGSTTPAIITILHTETPLLVTKPYVIV